ncbi:hypothetical protein F5X97DRAFT_322233 [Nemania serpens]|nr:hypothetical protein F5X97DRAFT_322233 [Nemania serpens]
MSRQHEALSDLVSCAGGLPLDGMIEGQSFQLQVKNNPKGTNTAGRCIVKIKSLQYVITVETVNVEFTEGFTIVSDDILQLAAGNYAIDANYYDKITNLSYDRYLLNFTVYRP